MDIMILNLPRDINKYQLTQMFKKYGKVDDCNLIMDEKNRTFKGFAFVTMRGEGEASAAIEALHGTKVGGKKIRVKISEQKNDEGTISKNDAAEE